MDIKADDWYKFHNLLVNDFFFFFIWSIKLGFVSKAIIYVTTSCVKSNGENYYIFLLLHEK